MDETTAVIVLARDFGVPQADAWSMRARASAEQFATGPDGVVLLAWPADGGTTRYVAARWRN